MSITLEEFYASVSREIRRGTSLDDVIPDKVRQALRWMEGQHTFIHMERYADLIISASANEPRAIPQPVGFKKMKGWRILDDSIYYDIRKIDFYDVSKIEEARPNAYWQDGKDYFWLDNTPDQDYNSEVAYTAYTIIPTDPAQELLVVNDFESLLLSATMVCFGPLLRSVDTINMYKDERDTMMKAAIDADIEERQSWQSESVQYGFEFREHINSRGDEQ